MEPLILNDGRKIEIPEKPKVVVESEEARKDVKAELEAIIEKNVPGVKGAAIVKLLRESGFYEAPASSKPQYHGCYEGGLADHTLLVLRHAASLREAWDASVSVENVVTAAVLHDVVKGQYRGKQYYLQEKGKYKYNPGLPCIGQNLMSIVQALRAGIDLDDVEIEAIMAQDGLYSEESKSVFTRYTNPGPLAYILHFADVYCSHIHSI